jgi:PhzF family phenazine biosynthesis protein
MFCPALGILEDPVSGNAHAMLGALLVRHHLLEPQDGIARFTGHQGQQVQRPGLLQVSIKVNAEGEPVSASIAGHAVTVFQTRIEL